MKYHNFLLLMLTMIVLLITGQIYSHVTNQQVTVEIRAIKYQGEVTFTSNIFASQIRKATPLKAEPENHNWWYELTIKDEDGVKKYFFTRGDYLFDHQKQALVQTTPQIKEVLEKQLKILNKQSPYGLLLEWDEVDDIFPKMSSAKITDLETGLTFNVQRRAGSSHADVQPLTAQDTKIFKEIYDGEWSWRRRAIMVEAGNFKIAASMHGMPHGQGAIHGNNFPGHFCIHFLNSTTHSNNTNLAHQLMVLKASGLVEDYLATQPPKKIVEIALTAMGQCDYQLLILSSTVNKELVELFNYMPKILGLKIHKLQEGEIKNQFMAEVEWYEEGTGKNIKNEGLLHVIRGNGDFLVKTEDLLKIFRILEK